MTQVPLAASDPPHSPEGFYVYASSYKRAAEALIECREKNLLIPTIYLLMHALELALKSFLLFEKIDAATLARRPYRHNVAHCLDEAEARGLFGLQTLTASERDSVVLASRLFDSKELNYFYERAVDLPSMDKVAIALKTVLAAVFDRISSSYFHEMRS